MSNCTSCGGEIQPGQDVTEVTLKNQPGVARTHTFWKDCAASLRLWEPYRVQVQAPAGPELGDDLDDQAYR